MRDFDSQSSTRWWARLLIAVMSLSLVLGAALTLHESQASAHRGLAERYTAKAQLAANFAGTFVTQLTSHERSVALSTLTGRHPTRAFTADVRGFGFPAAVLLDGTGRDIAVEPSAPRLIGAQLGAKYAHLTTALHGHIGVSNAVLSAADSVPVVAFAVPFMTHQGLRVFSGGFPLSDTPLSAYLADSSALKGVRLYLVDGNGTILATNGKTAAGGGTLAQRVPALSSATTGTRHGSYRAQSTNYTFASAMVPMTSWRLVITAPDSQVFASTSGITTWLPWLILAILSVLVALAAWLAIRLFEDRHLLAITARTDGMTGLANRASMTEQLEVLLASSSRHGFEVCVLMIDVDHFKALNDSLGHQAGDQALRHLARRLARSVRDGDLLARWGGEEFLAVLPYTGQSAGMVVAQRVCELVASEPLVIAGAKSLVRVSVSVGVALAADDGLEALVNRADIGLYRAKAAGRNTVRGAPAKPSIDSIATTVGSAS
jgi:diguanylate cyclase (GGDEF)-like protein